MRNDPKTSAGACGGRVLGRPAFYDKANLTVKLSIIEPVLEAHKAVPTGSGSAATSWAYAAHVAIAAAGAEMVRYGIEATPHRVVALSGGVFMNRILTGLLVPPLEALGLTVLQHRHTPPNDGCIAIGQALVAGASAGVR